MILDCYLHDFILLPLCIFWDSGSDVHTVSGDLAGFVGRGLRCPAAAGAGMPLIADMEPPGFHSQVLPDVRLDLQF